MGTSVFHDRDRWLSLLEGLQDPDTIRRLQDVGVGPGWRALEVGAGRGSIASWLADQVAEAGRVVATDVDTTLLEELGDERIEVLHHDVLADDLPNESFDLVHCRALLVHVGDPDRALERMAGWLKPGGALVAEEPWTDVARLAPDPVVAKAAEAIGQTLDGGFARRLPQALRRVGLERIEADAGLRFFDGGSDDAAFFRRVLEGASAKLVAAGALDAAAVRELRERFDDPTLCECGWPRIGAVGWKPPPWREPPAAA